MRKILVIAIALLALSATPAQATVVCSDPLLSDAMKLVSFAKSVKNLSHRDTHNAYLDFVDEMGMQPANMQPQYLNNFVKRVLRTYQALNACMALCPDALNKTWLPLVIKSYVCILDTNSTTLLYRQCVSERILIELAENHRKPLSKRDYNDRAIYQQ